MSRSLWVGNLAPGPHLEDELFAVFGRHGEVEEVHIRRAPKGPDCYAVVTMARPTSAAAAMHALDRRHVASLTQRELKCRPWDEAPSWRAAPQQQQQQPRAFGGGWWADEEEEEDEDEDDPIVELWVGNLCSRATRVALRRAFELFGEVDEVSLQPAPNPRAHHESGLQFAFVTLPASAAEAALEELNGLCVHELSGTMQLHIRQSKRSLKPLQTRHACQTAHAQHQPASQRTAALTTRPPQQEGQPAVAVQEQLEALLDDGSVAPLQGPVRLVSKRLVCEGPPSSVLWVGNVGGHASREDVAALFGSYGRVEHVRLNSAPGSASNQFGFVEMGSAAEAARAHAALHLAAGVGIAISASRRLKVRFAWPRSRVRPAAGSTPASHGSSGAASTAPAAAAPTSEPCCAHCGATAASVTLKRCSGCRATYFCSREHQLASWEAEHHLHCGQLAALGRELEQQAAALPRELLQLLADALRQPAGRPGRMVAAVVAQADAAAEVPA